MNGIAGGDQGGAVPHVVIVGAGFGGVSAARALARAPVRVTVMDRSNHHLFQPLLYQVATASLGPADIASPVRQILGRQRNAAVALVEVTGVDPDRREVSFTSGDGRAQTTTYDYLVLATGVEQSYFGHDEYARFAPGLKSLTDATAIRARLLGAIEIAELEPDPSKHRDLLTFVLVGAGPTGCEMAGAIAEMLRGPFRSEFRRVDPGSARIILVEGAPRILTSSRSSLPSAPTHRVSSPRGRGDPHRRAGREGRRRRRDRRRPAHLEPPGAVDGGGEAVAGGSLAQGRIRPQRPCARAARSERGGPARGLRGRRHVVPRARRPPPTRSSAGGAPAGALRRAGHRGPARRRRGARAVPVLRQGQHGSDRPGLRHPRVRPASSSPVCRLGLGGR